LLDLGFEKKIQDIISILDERLENARTGPRQTVLVSATMHSNLTQLAALSLQQPIMIGFRYIYIHADLRQLFTLSRILIPLLMRLHFHFVMIDLLKQVNFLICSDKKTFFVEGGK
jgi:hypothetical protein